MAETKEAPVGAAVTGVSGHGIKSENAFAKLVAGYAYAELLVQFHTRYGLIAGLQPDVSYWQGVVSYATAVAWKAAGIDRVYVKIGGGDDGIYHDSKHDGTVTNLHAAGIACDRYFFNGDDPTAAANAVAAWLSGNGSVGLQGDERFAWDVESPRWSAGQVGTAIDVLASHGYGPGGTDHYGSASTLDGYVISKSKGLDLWDADYGSNDGSVHPISSTGPWPSARLHQFTSNGSLPGYGGRLDLSAPGGASAGGGGTTNDWAWINQTVYPLSLIQEKINEAGYQPPLVADNQPGPLTEAGIKWYQGVKGLAQDGIVGPITAGSMFGAANPQPPIGSNITNRATSAIQERLNEVDQAGLTVDDKYGPLTTAAVATYQGKVGITVDGVYGPVTDAHLFGSGSVTVVVDGAWGPLTTEAIQACLGCTVDGILGPQTIGALQRLSGNPDDDGIWGPESAGYLQQWLVNRGYSIGPSGVDHDFGHDSVEALQRCINDGNLHF